MNDVNRKFLNSLDDHFYSQLLHHAKYYTDNNLITDEPAEENSQKESLQDYEGSQNSVNSNETHEKKAWSYDETIALISAIESRYDEMHHPKKKKHFWENISNDLLSQKFTVSIFI